MAFVQYSLSSRASKTGESQVLMSLRHSSNAWLRAKLPIWVSKSMWDPEKSKIKMHRISRLCSEKDINRLKAENSRALAINTSLENFGALVIKSFTEKLNDKRTRFAPSSDWLKFKISECSYMFSTNPETEFKKPNETAYIPVHPRWNKQAITDPDQASISTSIMTLPEAIKDFYQTRTELSHDRIKGYKVLYRLVRRYCMYSGNELPLNNISNENLNSLADFMTNEYKLFKIKSNGVAVPKVQYADIYKKWPIFKAAPTGPRAQNTTNDRLRKIRAVINWAITNRDCECSNPFKRYKIHEGQYGDPWYITNEERDALFNYDFSDSPALGIQRDIFVFQSLVGCRVGDLYRFTKANIKGDYLEYIPNKTKHNVGKILKVPLSNMAHKIIDKYKDYDRMKLFPLISTYQYNISIKKVFTLAGLTRMVTVLNPVTQQLEQKPINTIASSHLARRTFIGNLYNLVQDPNLIGSMSGHVAGSRAFERYHDYDMEIKRKIISQMEHSNG